MENTFIIAIINSQYLWLKLSFKYRIALLLNSLCIYILLSLFKVLIPYKFNNIYVLCFINLILTLYPLNTKSTTLYILPSSFIKDSNYFPFYFYISLHILTIFYLLLWILIFKSYAFFSASLISSINLLQFSLLFI